MFNLEQALLDWRRQMLDAGLRNPTLLDELESHLIEEAEQQMKSGVAAQVAFETAVGRMGQVNALKQEFKKIAGLKTIGARMKHSVLTLAGIPNHYLDTSMNTSEPSTNIEPGWATYLKAALFVAPAVCLWQLALVKCVPFLKDVADHAGAASLPGFARINLGIAELIKDNCLYLIGAVLLALYLLEWRFSNWQRYRRAAIGLTAFILNTSLLISLFLIIVTGALVAGMAIHRVK